MQLLKLRKFEAEILEKIEIVKVYFKPENFLMMESDISD
jgi:hypothetical protein